ncbi:MAG: hypothetical protein CVU92_04035 [Firmicutes bacterium HGW-Firmicutes-17]|nr:MAG: hypothetical protein CVU92_04035 [Firmicutes bacterium HGW-Firmicutes-17]
MCLLLPLLMIIIRYMFFCLIASLITILIIKKSTKDPVDIKIDHYNSESEFKHSIRSFKWIEDIDEDLKCSDVVLSEEKKLKLEEKKFDYRTEIKLNNAKIDSLKQNPSIILAACAFFISMATLFSNLLCQDPLSKFGYGVFLGIGALLICWAMDKSGELFRVTKNNEKIQEFIIQNRKLEYQIKLIDKILQKK